jgi:hypothetical protein
MVRQAGKTLTQTDSVQPRIQKSHDSLT